MLKFLIYIVTVTQPLFTAIVGFLAGHSLAVRRERRKEFNLAAKEFRDAFISIRQRLNKNESIRDILTQEFKAHDAAKKRFSVYLSGKSLARFEDLWAKYKQNYDTAVQIDLPPKFWTHS